MLAENIVFPLNKFPAGCRDSSPYEILLWDQHINLKSLVIDFLPKRCVLSVRFNSQSNSFIFTPFSLDIFFSSGKPSYPSRSLNLWESSSVTLLESLPRIDNSTFTFLLHFDPMLRWDPSNLRCISTDSCNLFVLSTFSLEHQLSALCDYAHLQILQQSACSADMRFIRSSINQLVHVASIKHDERCSAYLSVSMSIGAGFLVPLDRVSCNTKFSCLIRYSTRGIPFMRSWSSRSRNR